MTLTSSRSWYEGVQSELDGAGGGDCGDDFAGGRGGDVGGCVAATRDEYCDCLGGADKPFTATLLGLQEAATGVFGGGHFQWDRSGGVREEGVSAARDKREVTLWADHPDVEPRPPYFAILPKVGQMSFTLGDRIPDSPQDIARDTATVKRALRCAPLLGVNPADLAPTNAASAGVYGVFLARKIDGVRCLDDTEGLQMQFGVDGKIRQFCLMWPKLEREESCATSSPAGIIRCIRARKTPVAPLADERDYFGRVKGLARARKLTITQIRVYYGDGMFGEDPAENEPAKHVSPIAELEALADTGTNRVPIRLYAPILSADVKRLLGKRR